MTDLSLLSTDALIDELETRFEFFIAAWRDPSGKYHRQISCAEDGNGFAALGCCEWMRIGIAKQMGLQENTPDGH